jgi:hypothetical protein
MSFLTSAKLHVRTPMSARAWTAEAEMASVMAEANPNAACFMF